MSESPILRLPAELLLEIFGHTNIGWPFPVRLTHICREWREVSIAAPGLWTDVRIWEAEDSRGVNQPMAQLYLERSKTLALGFTIYSSSGSGIIAKIIISNFLKPCLNRVRRLTLMFIDGWAWSTALVPLLYESAPILEVLELSLTLSLGDGALVAFTIDAPRLHTLRCDGIQVPRVAYEKLVAFTLINWTLETVKELRGVLSHTVRHLRLEMSCHEDAGDRLPDIELPQLVSFIIEGNSCCSIPRISAPRLEKLSLDGIATESFNTLIHPSSSYHSLRVLVFIQLDLSELANSPGFWETHSRLTRIELYRCSNENQLLEQLQSKVVQYEAPVLPHLQFLAVSDMSNWPVLQTILSRRIAKGCRIARFRYSSNPRQREAETWLAEQNMATEYLRGEISHPMVGDWREREWQQEVDKFELDRGYVENDCVIAYVGRSGTVCHDSMIFRGLNSDIASGS